jgi:hypothetical protein
LQVERRTQIQDDPRSQRGDSHLDHGQQQESDPEDGEQVAIGRHHRAVDGPLHVEGTHDRDGLQREREDEHLGERSLQARHRPEEVAQPHGTALVRLPKFRGRRELEGDPGEVLGHFGHRQAAHAEGRIVDHGSTRVCRGEDHEVVEVPMQDAGHPQLRNLGQLQPQRARREAEPAGSLHEESERRSLERNGEAAAERSQVDAVAVEAGDHAQAREAALRGFRLQEHGQSPREAELDAG